MTLIAPSGPVYQAGTLSGNPLAVAAGLITLRLLKETDPYSYLEERTLEFTAKLKDVLNKPGFRFS